MTVAERIKKIPRPRLRGDRVIWLCVLMFAMFSVVAVFSSSTFIANRHNLPKTAIFISQLQSVGVGFLALIVCYAIPMGFYRRISFLIFAITLAGLVAAIIFGDETNDASRSLRIAGRTIQPLEFAKIGLILYLAKALELWKDSLNTFKDFFLKLLLPVGVTCAAVLPNSASTVLLFFLLSLLVMFFMGVKVRFLLYSIGIAVLLLTLMLLIYNTVYAGRVHPPGEEPGKVEKLFNRVGTAQKRVLNFFSGPSEAEESLTLSADEIKRIRDSKRQSENAKIAISQGGIFGKGPGKSTQRFSLSLAFSDFIFAFICEEYGLFGGFAVLMLYFFVLFRSIRMARECRTPYSEALVLGLSWLIAIQALLHIFVNVGILPVTGHTLPLISHGGTAYLVFGGAMGMILSVSRHLEKQKEQEALETSETSQSEPNHEPEN